MKRLITPQIAKKLLGWETEEDYADRYAKVEPGVPRDACRFYRGLHSKYIGPLDGGCPVPTKKMADGTLVVCWRLCVDSLDGDVVQWNDERRIVLAGGQMLIDVVMTDLPTQLDIEIVAIIREPLYAQKPLEYVI